ncbi:hypothetical protein D3C72_2328310 [compost metagenome]
MERIDPKTRHARHFERKVGFQVFLEVPSLGVVHDGVDQRLDLLMVQRWQIDAPYIAIHPNHRRQAGR